MLKRINNIYLLALSMASSLAFGQAHLYEEDPCLALLNQCGIVNIFTYGVDEVGNFMPRPGVNFEKDSKHEVYFEGKRELSINRDSKGRIESINFKNKDPAGEYIYIWGDPDAAANNKVDGTLYNDPHSTETINAKRWLDFVARKMKKKPEEVPANWSLENLIKNDSSNEDRIAFAKLTGFYANHYLQKKAVDRKLNVKFKYDHHGQCLVEKLNMNYPESDEKGKEENYSVNISEKLDFEQCKHLAAFGGGHEFSIGDQNTLNLCKKYGLSEYFNDNPSYSSEGLEHEFNEDTMKVR